MTSTTISPPAALTAQQTTTTVELPITYRRRDGQLLEGALPAEEHQALHLRMLHGQTNGLVEIAAGHRDSEGDLLIYTRRQPRYFLPGGASGDPEWLKRILALVARHQEKGDDIFVGPAIHSCASANKEDIQWTRWAWIDIDGGQHFGRVDGLMQRKPAAARIWSGGSGGEHVYWPLSEAMVARTVKDGGRTIVNPREVTQRTEKGGVRILGYRHPATGALIANPAEEWIEKGNFRLIHALGKYTRDDGEQLYVADIKCRNRSRLMRLAGTIHTGSGEYARISYFDPTLPKYNPKILFGDLPDPTSARKKPSRRLRRLTASRRERFPSDVYFWRLAGIDLPDRGNISCPNPTHPDEKPSCSVTDYVWFCHGCGAQGSEIDLWSLLNGGPTGDLLGGSQFLWAKAGAKEALGAL
jgi:hypothetical protein